MDLTGADLERNIAQGNDAGKFLANATAFEDGGRRRLWRARDIDGACHRTEPREVMREKVAFVRRHLRR